MPSLRDSALGCSLPTIPPSASPRLHGGLRDDVPAGLTNGPADSVYLARREQSFELARRRAIIRTCPSRIIIRRSFVASNHSNVLLVRGVIIRTSCPSRVIIRTCSLETQHAASLLQNGLLLFVHVHVLGVDHALVFLLARCSPICRCASLRTSSRRARCAALRRRRLIHRLRQFVASGGEP